MRPTTPIRSSRIRRSAALRGAYERSARSVVAAVRRSARSKADPEVMNQMLDSLMGVIKESTELLIAGKPVRVVEDDQTLTTQQAADLLNVSRPHLVKLLESRQIPQLPKAGRHRRVSRVAVLRYKRSQDIKRASALKQLAALSQSHRLGY